MSPGSAATEQRRSAHPVPSDLHSLADDELLALFFKTQSEGAFAALVARHGPLVLGVCQRVLGNSSDAEDAFQATFLVLVSKGRTLRQPEHLASWLYGVAQRTARKLKSKALLRNEKERQASAMSTKTDARDMTFHELQAVLDEEISRLPEKYALPLVLCYLEGKTNAQAAAQLGWPEGSMSRRLSRGRELLKSRLTRRGLALSAALIAYVFSRRAEAAVPVHLAEATVQAGRRVAEGAGVKEAASPAIAAVVAEVLASLSIVKSLAVPAAAVVTIVAALVTIGWQLGAPAFAANLFLGNKAPHSYTIGPDGTPVLTTGGGCGTAAEGQCGTQTGCGTTP